MNETAAAATERLDRARDEGHRSLRAALAAAVNEVVGTDLRAGEFSVDRLPSHLRLHVIVVDDAGDVVDAGDDLDAIRDRQAGTARSALAESVAIDERHDIVSWDDVGRLDRVVERREPGGNVVRAFPTLLDRGDRVALRIVDNEPLQRRAMRGGVRRLLLMAAAPTPTKIERTLDPRARLAVAAGSVSLTDLTSECIDAAVDAVMARYELPWDHEEFGRIERAVRDDSPQLAADALATAADILAAARRVHTRLDSLTAAALQPTVVDARAHVDRLVSAGFVRRSGLDRLPDVHRYVRGIEYRLDHLAGDVDRDRRRIAEVAAVEQAYAAILDECDRVPDELREVAWMLEELRVSTFAQPIGVKGSVSPKRIRKAISQAGSGCV